MSISYYFSEFYVFINMKSSWLKYLGSWWKKYPRVFQIQVILFPGHSFGGGGGGGKKGSVEGINFWTECENLCEEFYPYLTFFPFFYDLIQSWPVEVSFSFTVC